MSQGREFGILETDRNGWLTSVLLSNRHKRCSSFSSSGISKRGQIKKSSAWFVGRVYLTGIAAWVIFFIQKDKYT